MSERGFVPFSAAGAVIVVVALFLAAQAASSGHQRSLASIDDVSTSSLLMKADAVHANLQSVARQAAYLAISEVSAEASNYEGSARLAAINSLATEYFEERATGLSRWYPGHDARIELDLAAADWPTIEISESGGGYASALASLPAGSRVRLTSWDGKTKVAAAFENVSVFIDSRYFLLESCMDNFLGSLEDISRSWQAMEYAQAISGALLAGRVELNGTRSRALFEAAWAFHELATFGSSDYWAQAPGLTYSESLGEWPGLSSLATISRENIYQLLPPPPIKPTPGLSVYHELKVRGLTFKRQDPAGLLGSPAATPIPLGTSGVTVWWAQWEITVELSDSPIEEVFDFDNPTLPVLFANGYVHRPLAYRWRLPEREFKTVVSFFNIKPFSVFAT